MAILQLLLAVLLFCSGLVNARFLLSCRVISGLCQESSYCYEEMSHRFPDCYMDMIKRSELEDGLSIEKRAPAYKLRNILKMVDRIPTG